MTYEDPMEVGVRVNLYLAAIAMIAVVFYVTPTSLLVDIAVLVGWLVAIIIAAVLLFAWIYVSGVMTIGVKKWLGRDD